MTEKLYKNRTAQGSADVNYRTKLRYYTYKFGFEMLSKPKQTQCELQAIKFLAKKDKKNAKDKQKNAWIHQSNTEV